MCRTFLKEVQLLFLEENTAVNIRWCIKWRPPSCMTSSKHCPTEYPKYCVINCLGCPTKSNGAVFPWMLSSPVNSGEPALKHGLPSPESHHPSGTTQSVFTPRTSPYKHCCLLIEHQQRTNARWCCWGLDTSALRRGFFSFSSPALIEWFQSISLRLLSERLSATAPERLVRNVLDADCRHWILWAPQSHRASIYHVDPFLKNNHSLSSEEVPELIINKCWMLRGRGASCGEYRELSWGVGGGKEGEVWGDGAGVFWMMEHSMGCESGTSHRDRGLTGV